MMPTLLRLERASKILLIAANEGTITWAVAPVLLPFDWLVLSPTYDAIPAPYEDLCHCHRWMTGRKEPG